MFHVPEFFVPIDRMARNVKAGYSVVFDPAGNLRSRRSIGCKRSPPGNQHGGDLF